MVYECRKVHVQCILDWAASVAQLAEHWTSNPVVTGLNPVRGSSVFFSLSAFGLCLRTLPYFPLPYLLSFLAYFPLCIYMYEIDHVHCVFTVCVSLTPTLPPSSLLPPSSPSSLPPLSSILSWTKEIFSLCSVSTRTTCPRTWPGSMPRRW